MLFRSKIDHCLTYTYIQLAFILVKLVLLHQLDASLGPVRDQNYENTRAI